MAKNHYLNLGSEESSAVASPATGNNDYLNGKLYDVRIYNYPLTLTQINPVKAVPTAPTLTAQLISGNRIQLSWSAAGYVVQTSSALTGGGWTTSSLTVTPQNGQFTATDTIGAGPKYYRLYFQ